MVVLQWIWAEIGDKDIPSYVLYYVLRGLMFTLSFVLEDWALHELSKSPRHYRLTVVLVASSYVTWTYQTHTFSNSVETIVVLWTLVMFQRLRESRSVRNSRTSHGLHLNNFLAEERSIAFTSDSRFSPDIRHLQSNHVPGLCPASWPCHHSIFSAKVREPQKEDVTNKAKLIAFQTTFNSDFRNDGVVYMLSRHCSRYLFLPFRHNFPGYFYQPDCDTSQFFPIQQQICQPRASWASSQVSTPSRKSASPPWPWPFLAPKHRYFNSINSGRYIWYFNSFCDTPSRSTISSSCSSSHSLFGPSSKISWHEKPMARVLGPLQRSLRPSHGDISSGWSGAHANMAFSALLNLRGSSRIFYYGSKPAVNSKYHPSILVAHLSSTNLASWSCPLIYGDSNGHPPHCPPTKNIHRIKYFRWSL